MVVGHGVGASRGGPGIFCHIVHIAIYFLYLLLLFLLFILFIYFLYHRHYRISSQRTQVLDSRTEKSNWAHVRAISRDGWRSMGVSKIKRKEREGRIRTVVGLVEKASRPANGSTEKGCLFASFSFCFSISFFGFWLVSCQCSLWSFFFYIFFFYFYFLPVTTACYLFVCSGTAFVISLFFLSLYVLLGGQGSGRQQQA